MQQVVGGWKNMVRFCEERKVRPEILFYEAVESPNKWRKLNQIGMWRKFYSYVYQLIYFFKLFKPNVYTHQKGKENYTQLFFCLCSQVAEWLNVSSTALRLTTLLLLYFFFVLSPSQPLPPLQVTEISHPNTFPKHDNNLFLPSSLLLLLLRFLSHQNQNSNQTILLPRFTQCFNDLHNI